MLMIKHEVNFRCV